jgi:CheY-like chemotaxis protein
VAQDLRAPHMSAEMPSISSAAGSTHACAIEDAPRRTVMIVDDSPTIRKILGLTLERAGYKVMAEPDGESALERLTQVVPDVMLLDIAMPNIDGIRGVPSPEGGSAYRARDGGDALRQGRLLRQGERTRRRRERISDQAVRNTRRSCCGGGGMPAGVQVRHV